MADIDVTFVEYPSMPVVKGPRKRSGQNSADEWIALEKIHGSNFSFIATGGNVTCAKRNDLIHQGEFFYNYERVRDNVSPLVEQLWAALREEVAGLTQLTVFGELFGGIYPGLDEGEQFIQRGIYYSPGIHFCAYDILTLTASGEKMWMDYDQAMKHFDRIGFFYSRPVARGTVNELYEVDIDFDSTIPALLGLPPPGVRNLVEGVVIKPVAAMPLEERKSVKKKNAKFSEVNPAIPNTQWEAIRDERKRLCLQVKAEVGRYAKNANRLEAVESKHFRLAEGNSEDVAALLAEDAVKDFRADMGDLCEQLAAVDRSSLVEKYALEGARSFVKESLQLRAT